MNKFLIALAFTYLVLFAIRADDSCTVATYDKIDCGYMGID